jgi:hypothetical protein
MSARIHRLVITLGSIFTGLASVWGLSEVQVLGIPEEVPAVCTLVGAILMLVANAIRANYPVEGT